MLHQGFDPVPGPAARMLREPLVFALLKIQSQTLILNHASHALEPPAGDFAIAVGAVGPRVLKRVANVVEVQAIESSGLYTGISAELISSAPQPEESNALKIPWFGLLFTAGGLGYLFNEWRKNKVKMSLSPVLKFN